MNTEHENFELIYSYTLADAVADGILIDLSTIDPRWCPPKSLFTHVSHNLLNSLGYIDLATHEANIPNIPDLLNQSLHQIKVQSINFSLIPEPTYILSIKLPDGDKSTIWACQNELSADLSLNGTFYTLLLPEDY